MDGQANGDVRPTLAGLKPGDAVRVVCPENARLHGAAATVEALEAWGAHLRVAAAATGRWRALWSEMAPVDADAARSRAVASGHTGDCCDKCGSFAMVRDGKCLTCTACGSTAGGCS